MSKQKKNRPVDLEEFSAYDSYTYSYEHEQGDEQPPEHQPPYSAEAVKNARERKKNSTFFVFFLILAMITVTIIVLLETVFRLEDVYVFGNETKTAEQVVVSSGLARGVSIFSIEPEKVAKTLENDHSLIFKGLEIVYPNVVNLYVEERKPVAALEHLGMLYVLDKEGFVLSVKNDLNVTSMPKVNGLRVANAQEGRVLGFSSQAQKEAYTLIVTELVLQQYIDQVERIDLSFLDNIYLITYDEVNIRVGSVEDFQRKLRAIRASMDYLAQNDQEIISLDVTIEEDVKYLPK